LNLIRDSLNANFASFGHPDVWPIKDISPPMINLGNRSRRSDKSKPKTRFKDHDLRAGRDMRGNQEQTQMIATAIGRPMANAPPIAKVKAERKFT
jgi:hypothetical protein